VGTFEPRKNIAPAVPIRTLALPDTPPVLVAAWRLFDETMTHIHEMGWVTGFSGVRTFPMSNFRQSTRWRWRWSPSFYEDGCLRWKRWPVAPFQLSAIGRRC
jgi:hypothetical protein